jgi:hypothetical protein
MSGRQKAAIVLLATTVLGIAVTTALLLLFKAKPIILQGAVIREDADVKKQLPLANVEITATDGFARGTSSSDTNGFFRLILRPEVRLGQTITLQFRHPEYQPLAMTTPLAERLYIIRMTPLSQPTPPLAPRPAVAISNIALRYSTKNTSLVNIGSAVKTFEVVNTANVPCQNRAPCSPDGKWKAATSSISLDAGEGNKFQNVRVSCIAGPCPFTRVDSNQLLQNGRMLQVTARNWSDTTMFLLEAEVFHPMVSDMVLLSYPLIFGQALNFTLPADAEGTSLVADVNGARIVFPLGPSPCLSWAACSIQVNPDQTKVYRCELRPGYEFR